MESKYAPELRKRGFTPATEEQQAYIERRTSLRLAQFGIAEEKLSRQQRRAAERQKKRPFFSVTPFGTMAMDETGWHWNSDTVVDLSDLGFHNAIGSTFMALFLQPLDTSSGTH